MHWNFLVQEPHIDSQGSVRLKDMDSDRRAEWRTFLTRKGHFPPQGVSGQIEQLEEATKRFQKEDGAKVTGNLDRETVEKALTDPFWPGVTIRPGANSDFRRDRPFFLIPVLESRFPFQNQIIADQVKAYVQQIGSQNISDIFVVSHGWHRNYLGGVQAYDRLVSRFSMLWRRGKFGVDEQYRPLFLAVHWNSDPGKDIWLDRAGRRDKASFLELVERTFEPNPTFTAQKSAGDLVDDFEHLFEQLACNVLPDTEALASDPASLHTLTQVLNAYKYRGVEQRPTLDEKVCTLWRCYWESQAKGFLLDQTEKPKPAGDWLTGIGTLGKFLLAVVGLPAIAGFIWKLVSKRKSGQTGTSWLDQAVDKVGNALSQIPWWEQMTGTGRIVIGVITWVAVSFLILLIFQILYRRKRTIAGRTQPAKGFPFIQVVAWIGPQLLCLTPILIFLLFTFLFRTPVSLLALAAFAYGPQNFWGYVAGAALLAICAIVSWIAAKAEKPLSGVFRERLLDEGDRARNARDILAAIARAPVRLVQSTVGPDSSVRAMTSMLDNQLAFFAMQRKGVQAGVELGQFVRKLVTACDLGERPLHLIGHSFGGLVVVNAARTIVGTRAKSSRWHSFAAIFRPQMKARSGAHPGHRITSLCTVQGAIASSWYTGEEHLLTHTDGAIASIFTGYDTANGVYYPLANNGRLAAGYLGICRLGAKGLGGFREATYIGRNGEFSMVVDPPDLSKYSFPTGPTLLNIDASRICYEGNPAAGGGHDDVFKDDVVNLIWSVTRLRPRP
ncbi:hypothetical protein [Fimbriimonas ginsengisoli]|uniref:Uncharacterized protein n=1 Tax=Fimbriimonas ginsengisoli Gsoil 348 TaxID=661478 RepID=A0A068NYH3_FIMGI|nr:hypothetical protein [Fimbriimonas ginsengisoli]AIE88135.1 hypothetical protein OP10G_4767 [Fimbriimonas ginsengisoli Gsoil 348]